MKRSYDAAGLSVKLDNGIVVIIISHKLYIYT